ncbi:unnamed protein product [Trichobilharzia regenti]|nr:unnamed protein product [Trichobilharzia regenti]
MNDDDNDDSDGVGDEDDYRQHTIGEIHICIHISTDFDLYCCIYLCPHNNTTYNITITTDNNDRSYNNNNNNSIVRVA